MHPRILTTVTVPSGGWRLKVYFTTNGGSDYDLPGTMTIPAGDYFVSGDNQSDDFLREFMKQFRDYFQIPFGTPYGLLFFKSSIDGKVHFEWTGIHDPLGEAVKFAWTELEGPEIAAVLGFDSSSDDTLNLTGGTLDADYYPAYQWVANEDGHLAEHFLVDEEEGKALQSVSDSGIVRTQLVSRRHTNVLRLQHVAASLMFSDGVGYGEAPVYPWARNIGLECWWREAIQGKRFRVYRNFPRNMSSMSTRAQAYLPSTAANTTTFTTSAVLATQPQALKGHLLTAGGIHYFIQSHTASVITVPNAPIDGRDLDDEIAANAYAFDGSYRTYVLDAAKMSAFRPTEVGRVNRFNLEIPLRRYVP